MQATIPRKSILRLSTYRRHLRSLHEQGETHVYSHKLAGLTGFTPSQVRRDLMGAKAEGNSSKGYHIKNLIRRLDEVLDGGAVTNVVLFGAGRLGKAMLQFFLNQRPNLQIIAAFDTDPGLTGRVICGVHCYDVNEASEVIHKTGASIAIITAPGAATQEISSIINGSGIRGVLNFAPTALLLPDGVEELHVDITSQLEALACMARTE